MFVLCVCLIQTTLEKQETKKRDNLLTIDITLKNKKNYKFLFDTGAMVSLLDEKIAKEIKAKRRFVLLADSIPPQNLVYKSLKLPLIQKKNIGYRSHIKFSLNKQNYNRKSSFFWSKKNTFFETTNISGILGWNFIKKYNWVIDVKENKIKISHSKNITVSTDSVALSSEIKEIEGLPYIDLLVNHTNRFNILLDTGASDFLSIPTNIFNKKEKTTNSKTVYGKNEEKYVQVDTVNINGLRFRNAPIGTYSKLKTHKKLLGLEFMRLFDKVIINNTHNKVYFLK